MMNDTTYANYNYDRLQYAMEQIPSPEPPRPPTHIYAGLGGQQVYQYPHLASAPYQSPSAIFNQYNDRLTLASIVRRWAETTPSHGWVRATCAFIINL